MTGLWSIVTPSAGVNYIRNPSLTHDTSGWSDYTAGGGTGARTRTGDAALQGFFGYRIAKTGTTGGFGAIVIPEAQNVFVAGQYARMSIYTRIPDGSRLEFFLKATASSSFEQTINTDGPFTGRIEGIIGPFDGNSSVLYCRAAIPDGYGGTVDIDGAQIEIDTVTFEASTFFDGDTDGCYWSGGYYATSSVRPVTVRTGGTIENFDDYGLFFTSMNDVGMAGVNHNIDPYAVQDGALYRNSRTPRRVFNLSGQLIGTSLEDLHDKRRALIDLFKNDLTGQNEPFWLRYSGAGETLQIQCRYDSGLEGSRRPRDGFSERLSLRFVAVDPFWEKDHNVGVDIAPPQVTPTLYRIMARINGTWDNLAPSGTGPDNGVVYAIAYHKGVTYIGGSFTTVNSDSDMSFFAYFDGSAWGSLGTGANGDVNAIAVASNGDVFAGGAFTSMGGVANTTGVARWDKSAQTWNALGTGVNADVEALAIAPDETLYVGGSFTQANGATRYRWTDFDILTDTWGVLGGIGPDNNAVLAIAVASNGDVYYGGSFTAVNSDTDMSYAAYHDGSSSKPLLTGMDDIVRAIEPRSNGNVYIGGDFDDAGGIAVRSITEWDGNTFSAMNNGINTVESVYSLRELDNDILGIGGDFTVAAGPTNVSRFALWNGSTYYASDWKTSSAYTVYAIESGGKYEFILGGNFTTNVQTANTATVTNDSVRSSYPRFSIYAAYSGNYRVSLYRVELRDVDSAILFNGYDMQNEDTLTIDTRPGKISVVSNAHGNLLGDTSRVSNPSEMRLLPGDNLLGVFAAISGTPTYALSMIWNELFWSVDGAD